MCLLWICVKEQKEKKELDYKLALLVFQPNENLISYILPSLMIS